MPIFSHLCRISAGLGLLLSIPSFLAAFNISSNALDRVAAIAQADSEFKFALKILLGSIVLGTLAEISLALHRKSRE